MLLRMTINLPNLVRWSHKFLRINCLLVSSNLFIFLAAIVPCILVCILVYLL